MAQRSVSRSAWTTNRTVAFVLGVVFTVIGLFGFIVAPGMQVGNLLGFDVDIIHNIVHLVTGLLGLAAAFSGWSRIYNQVFGIVYLVVGLAGLIYPGLYFDGRLLGLFHANAIDHGFHLIVGAVATATGFLADRNRATDYGSTSRRAY